MSAIKETPVVVDAAKEDVVVPTTVVEPIEASQVVQTETSPAVEEALVVPATTTTAIPDSVIAPEATASSEIATAPAPAPIAVPEPTETPKAVADAPHADAKDEVKDEIKKSPKKEKKGIFARISGIFSSSPEKKEKVAKTENPATTETAVAPVSTEPVVNTTATDATEVPSCTAAIVEPTKVEEPLVAQSSEDKLTEGVNALKIEKEPKKETVTGDHVVAAPVDAETVNHVDVATTEKKDEAEIKPSTSAPKMHRRISARIGQYIDTKFGEKKEKTVTTPKNEKKAHKIKKEDGSSSSSEDEAKKHEAPVLAAPLAMEPLGELVTEAEPVETKQEDKIEEAPKPIVVA